MAVKTKKTWTYAILLCVFAAHGTFAQPPVTQKPAPAPKTSVPRPPVLPHEYQGTTERSIEVDPNVNLRVCVSEGTIKVNGWDRGEVRVFVRSGRLPGFKVLEKDSISGKANWLLLTNARAEGARPGPMPECLAGELIELDVPVKTSLTISGRAADTTIDTIKKISVKLVEGNIALRNIGGGISASTYQGNLTVENSGGAISLDSQSGNILAYDVSPGQIGDLFRAKTSSGSIMLQHIEHRQIEGSTISGTLAFNGKFLPGGLYNFKTSNGPIRMVVPEKSAFTIKASYGFGTFYTDLPLKYVYQNVSDAGKNLLARLGAGGSDINLTTNTGTIQLRKNADKP